MEHSMYTWYRHILYIIIYQWRRKHMKSREARHVWKINSANLHVGTATQIHVAAPGIFSIVIPWYEIKVHCRIFCHTQNITTVNQLVKICQRDVCIDLIPGTNSLPTSISDRWSVWSLVKPIMFFSILCVTVDLRYDLSYWEHWMTVWSLHFAWESMLPWLVRFLWNFMTLN